MFILNNSCQTFDELQSDYLLQRDTIETLTNRVNTLTQELIEQNTITSSLIEDVSQLNEEVSLTKSKCFKWNQTLIMVNCQNSIVFFIKIGSKKTVA